MQVIKLQVEKLLAYLVRWDFDASGTESLLFYVPVVVHYDFIPLAESRI